MWQQSNLYIQEHLAAEVPAPLGLFPTGFGRQQHCDMMKSSAIYSTDETHDP